MAASTGNLAPSISSGNPRQQCTGQTATAKHSTHTELVMDNLCRRRMKYSHCLSLLTSSVLNAHHLSGQSESMFSVDNHGNQSLPRDCGEMQVVRSTAYRLHRILPSYSTNLHF